MHSLPPAPPGPAGAHRADAEVSPGDLAGQGIAVPSDLPEALRDRAASWLGRSAPGWRELPAEDDKDAIRMLLDRPDEVAAAVSSHVFSGPYDLVGDGRKQLEYDRPGTLERTRILHTTEAPDKELATEMKLKVTDIEELKKLSVGSLSLDAPVAADEDVDLGDLVADPSDDPGLANLHYESLGQEIGFVLSELTSRESTILTHYFGLGGEEKKTLEQIGRMMGLTRERIRQIKEEALGKLRAAPGLEELRVYLN